MKKLMTSMFLVVFAVAMLNITKASTPVDELPASCIAFDDWCNICSRWEQWGAWACTLKACDIATTYVPVCTKYATSDVVEEPTMCTMQYDPVCAEVQVQCVTTPCNPVKETFGNACMMNANKNAKFLYNGECKTDDTNPTDLPLKACTKEYMPICGTKNGNDVTYWNMCMLEAAAATIKYAGECKEWLEAGEGSAYSKVSAILDTSYLAWKYTPIQSYNYTQTIISKIDNKLQTSRMKKWAYDRHIQLKRFLQSYMSLMTLSQ